MSMSLAQALREARRLQAREEAIQRDRKRLAQIQEMEEALDRVVADETMKILIWWADHQTWFSR